MTIEPSQFHYLGYKNILVTGGTGFLGRHVIAELQRSGVPKERIFVPRRHQCDLRTAANCRLVAKNMDVIIHLAGNVGGIGYNQQNPARLFYDNLMMGVQLMEAARERNVGKFVAIGTVCSYPKHTPTPFSEDALWDGYPEETNAPYGLAKKMLLVQAQTYRQQYGMNAIYLIPVNLYGPHDHFEPEKSHVIPALIKKIDDAKKTQAPSIQVWGTGTASREFLYVEDAARAIVLAARFYNKPEPVNIGAGREITIRNLVETIARLMEYRGEITWDATKPDGQPRRMLDTSRAQKEFDFVADTDFEDGLRKTIAWYRQLPSV
ncbi:MAG TPA: GDP-L-fucose synthase [Candidatus Paceibacterota bacterium]|nr:GDP-L-fucose synthase [Candidatus Paceibacterota bacterium]